MAHNYNVGTRAWQPDPTEGWIASEVESKNIQGDQVKLVFRLENGEVRLLPFAMLFFLSQQDSNPEAQKTKTLDTTLAALLVDNNVLLPPLMNPAILEASDDLTNLSHLNEPAGTTSIQHPNQLALRFQLMSVKCCKQSSYDIHKRKSTHTAVSSSLPQIRLQESIPCTFLVWCRFTQANSGRLRPLIYSPLRKKHSRKVSLSLR